MGLGVWWYRVLVVMTCISVLGFFVTLHITLSPLPRCAYDGYATTTHTRTHTHNKHAQPLNNKTNNPPTVLGVGVFGVLFSSGVLSPSVFSWNVSEYTLTVPESQLAEPYVLAHITAHKQQHIQLTLATNAGTLSSWSVSCPSGVCVPPSLVVESLTSPGPLYDLWQAPQRPPPYQRTAIQQRWLPQIHKNMSLSSPYNESFPYMFPHAFPVNTQFTARSQTWQEQHGAGSSFASVSADAFDSEYVLSVGPGLTTLVIRVTFPIIGTGTEPQPEPDLDQVGQDQHTISQARSWATRMFSDGAGRATHTHVESSLSPSQSQSVSVSEFTVRIIKRGATQRWVPVQKHVLLNTEQQVLLDSIPSQFASRAFGQTKAFIQGCHTSTNNHATIQIHDGRIYVAPERVLGGLYYRVHNICNLLYLMMDLSPLLVPNRTIFLLDQNDVPSINLHQKPQCAVTNILAFTTNHRAKHHIIPIPDFSFWTHAQMYSNWNESRKQFYNLSWSIPSVSVRSPRLFFRGVRINSRVSLMDEMNRRGHDFAGTSDKDFKSLKRQCREYRYLVYFGGWDVYAWSTRLKYQLLCGSAVLADRVHTDYAFTEFWNKLLVPYVHYIPVTLDNILQQHGVLESSLWYASLIGSLGRSLVWDVLTYEFALEYLAAALHEHTKHVQLDTLTDPAKDKHKDPELRLHLYPRQASPMMPVTSMRDMWNE